VAYLMKEQGMVVARVIYDGAPEAGKTTNARQICRSVAVNRRSAFESPGSQGSRTEYFDWLDFQGGYVHGYNLRCQILAVPGQFSMQVRREHLLKTADTIVFVADSRPEAREENLQAFAFLKRIIKATPPHLPPPSLLIQANKQDLPGALPPAELARQLGLEPSIPVLGAQAVDGGGVLQSFVVAMRLAVDRIQALLGANILEDLPQDAATATALYSSMRELEVLPDSVEASISSAVRAIAGFQEEPAATAPPREEDTPAPPIPFAGNIAAGHLWPTLKARSILAAINGVNQIVRRRVIAPWAPAGSIELQTPNGWILHTSDNWITAGDGAGRMDLLRMVRRCLAQPDWIPEGRAFFIANHESTWRIWMISPELSSVYETFTRALRGDHLPDLIEGVRVLHLIYAQIQRTNGVSWFANFGNLRNLALQNGKPVCLSVPDLSDSLEPAQWRASALSTMASGIQNCLDTIRLDEVTAGRLREAIRRAGLPDDGVAAILRQKLGSTARAEFSRG
jgi:signal recognition particle receptor subunit beta